MKNQTSRTLGVLALTTFASIALMGCMDKGATSSDSMSALELPAALRGDGEVVATVNGNKLYKTELYNHAKTRTGQEFDALEVQAKNQIFDEFIQLESMSQRARKDGIGKDNETIIKLRNIEKNILEQAMFTAKDVTDPISDAEINAKYEAEKAGFEQMSYKARHILLETEEAAKAVIAELKKGGDFEKLAKEKSTGPSGVNGGDLGWFTADRMVAPFSAATAALEVGKFSQEPVKTQFGYHVIIKDEEKQAEAPPLESLRPRLEQQIKQAKVKAILDDVEANAVVEKLLVIAEEKPVELTPAPAPEKKMEEKVEEKTEG